MSIALSRERHAFDGGIDFAEQVGLDRGEHGLGLAHGAAFVEQLVMPADFGDRKWDRLLRLEPDQLIHLIDVERRELHELAEHRLAGDGIAHPLLRGF